MNSAQSTHQLVAAVSGQLPHWRAVSPAASRSPNAASATLSARKWFSIMLLGLHMTWQDGQTTAPLLSPANKTITFVKSVHLSFSLKPLPHTFSLSTRKWYSIMLPGQQYRPDVPYFNEFQNPTCIFSDCVSTNHLRLLGLNCTCKGNDTEKC